ncbi:MAG: tRNA-guanine transglycosylase [Candidatus Moranbacteria bacterium]|nr:tRNA-guanine transglycosylase [Candidatus Moranbacteria bacterium]
MKKQICIKGKKYKLPIYLPDATRAVVKTVDSLDLVKASVKGAVVNTYHLMTEPGVSVLKKLGGIKAFMNFPGLITSDSGGWQIFSLIHRNKNQGKITDEGVAFSVGKGNRELFSPEKSIETQFDIGSDIIVCLDDFTPPRAKKKQIVESVNRTLKWAKVSKDHYQKLLKQRKISNKKRPFLFAVIQGDNDKELRAYCAEKLLEMGGFDGFGFGGYPMDENGRLNLDLAKYVCDLIPNNYFKFALGVGKPQEIAACFNFGWQIFDCTLPTRDGRHMRLYVFNKNPKKIDDLMQVKNHGYLYINREKYRRDQRKISDFCDCHTCKNYSRSYLHHLFNINDATAYRLATLHNLRIYTKTMEVLRQAN